MQGSRNFKMRGIPAISPYRVYSKVIYVNRRKTDGDAILPNVYAHQGGCWNIGDLENLERNCRFN